MHGDAPDQPGATRRGYRIERFIGKGSAAAVYEARRLGPDGPGERVACKVMHAEQRDAPGFRRLIWHEAVVGLRFTAGHPNLVEVLDFFDDAKEQLCIVMELVDGANLEELRGLTQRFPFPIARRIAIEVLEALLHLHGRDVLYRDLSLYNILATAGGAVKLTDFGIARVMEQGHVRTSEIRGTPVYLSPEAIEGRPLDARSDLFSLGAVLYDLVAGQPPCGNHELRGAVFVRNLFGSFEPLPPDTPEDLAELITGLIEKDRDARWPQTAAEALALLRSHDQPLASPEELAALVGPAQARRDQALAGKRPANLLPAGYVLAPRDDRQQTEHTAGKPPVRAAGGEDQSLPARAAEKDAPALPAHVAESGPPALPERVAASEVEVLSAREVADAVPEHIDDAPPDALIDRVSASVPDPRGDAQPDRVAEGASGGTLHWSSRLAGRFAARRVILAAALGACILLLGSLLDDGVRVERAASEAPPPSEARALAPMPLAGAESAVQEQSEAPSDAENIVEPRRTSKRVDTRRSGRDGERRRDGRTGPVWMRRKLAPITSEPPAWGTP
jgi:hypothetical protein